MIIIAIIKWVLLAFDERFARQTDPGQAAPPEATISLLWVSKRSVLSYDGPNAV